jgi:hypothetical protein
MLILTKSTISPYSCNSSSTTGDTSLHGPHHSAQKSTKTGFVEAKAFSNYSGDFMSFIVMYV